MRKIQWGNGATVERRMRIGVFGGSFDPVHLGHLVLAEQCREQARLDTVLWVPAARQPLKTDQQATPFGVRVEMLKLAIGDQPGFAIDTLEGNRSGPSYTADTLDELHARHPNDELFLLIGSDSLADFPLWHAPERIIHRAALVVMERPGWPVASADELLSRLNLSANAKLMILKVDVPQIDIASRDLRRRVRDGRSIRYMTPIAIEEFIRAHGLYESQS